MVITVYILLKTNNHNIKSSKHGGDQCNPLYGEWFEFNMKSNTDEYNLNIKVMASGIIRDTCIAETSINLIDYIHKNESAYTLPLKSENSKSKLFIRVKSVDNLVSSPVASAPSVKSASNSCSFNSVSPAASPAVEFEYETHASKSIKSEIIKESIKSEANIVNNKNEEKTRASSSSLSQLKSPLSDHCKRIKLIMLAHNSHLDIEIPNLNDSSKDASKKLHLCLLEENELTNTYCNKCNLQVAKLSYQDKETSKYYHTTCITASPSISVLESSCKIITRRRNQTI